MKTVVVMFALTLAAGTAFAGDDHALADACKAECPKAKSEHEAHDCLKKFVKSKKADAKWKESACAKALASHEEHEKKSGHDEDGHKH